MNAPSLAFLPTWLRFTAVSVSIFLAALALPSAAVAQVIVHEFYVPIPEAQARTALATIEPASGIVGQTMDSVVSIVATATGTVVYYDHWEDGYEIDLQHPTQSTTKIWGDGNNANGIPPGFANDPATLASGAVISLRNLVPLPRDPAAILYDGRDRFGGTKALVSTRTAWATAPGTVLAGSIEMPATLDYGTSFISPVGQDVVAASMFEYVGLFVMAKDDGTSVTIDTDGSGPNAPATITLNRGESHQVNGGVKKGATVTSTKLVQVQLITGDIGARYETDWFTLFPFDQWSSTYYSPVGTAADGDATFGFFYNPNGGQITINVLTCLGTGSFNIPAGGVHQYQMPQNCGAKFESVGDQPFFGVVMVGANPAANNVHDWGFTLVPTDALTTEAVVGWGPGSGDLTQNGSPVWITPVEATRVYVDLNGDRNGALTDPDGNKYDSHYDIGALETRTIYDPDKDQTAMRLYTLDGVKITAAWGQDPAVAGPGNPFLDVGTTVLPFPVPVLTKTAMLFTDVAPAGYSLNDVVEYTVTVENRGLLPLGNLVVLDPLPSALSYLANTTTRDGSPVPDDTVGSTLFPLDESGHLIPIILRSGSTVMKYRATITQSGTITNTATNTNYKLTDDEVIVVPPGGGSTPCGIQFTDVSGNSMSAYSVGALVYGTLTDPDANNNAGAVENITVVVTNTSNGDAEFVTLVETGVNTGIFRNTAGMPTSQTAGLAQMDGTLNVAPLNNLSFSYTDPEFSETCSDTATIAVPSLNKILYLSTDGSGSPDQDMDRIDPVAANDPSTAQTAALSTGAPAIAVDNVSTGSANNPFTSVTVSHTTGSGPNRLMLVGINYEDDNTAGISITSVTYGGTPLTLVGSRASSQEAASQIWRLVNPSSGSANLVVNVSGANTGDTIHVGVTTFTGVDQATPLGTFASNIGTTSPASVVVTSAAGELVFDALALDDARTATVDASQTQRWNAFTETANTDGIRSASSTEAGAGSVTMSWVIGADSWALCAVPIKPATSGGGGAVSFVSSKSTSASSNTVTLTGVYTGAASDRLLLVGVSMTGTGRTVSGITYGGTPLSLVQAEYHTDTNEARSELWRLIAPAAGTADVVVTIAGGGANNTVVGAAAFSGAHQTTPLGTPATNEGTSTVATVGVASGGDDLVFAMSSIEIAGSFTQAGGQIERWDQGLSTVSSTASSKTGASGTVTMTSNYSGSAEKWTMIGAAIKPVSAAGGNTTVSFLQTPVFASGFTMPAGSAPGSQAYFSVTSGSMPANPSISAVLKYGGITIATSSSCSSSGGLLTFTFPALGGNVTVPAGQAITLEVTTAQSGVAFTIDYDSTTKPSKITLPTTTVIDVNSLAVYDAPHPAGSIVTSLANGATVYVRSTVSDPFGAYDITSLGLSIDGPGAAGDISTTLTAPNVVATTAGTKTYEYEWATGSTSGSYNITATGNEGTEGIQHQRSIPVTLTFLDLGTPSTTVFTTGLNGPETEVYAGNEQVCVRITDLDQNLNAAAIETIQATITSLVGDSELVTLTETGIDTGIFVFCIPASTTAPSTHDNGTLHAVLGDVLNVNYVDPTDPTDTGSDVATIPNIAPAITVTKTLTLPADGQAVVGEAVQYLVQVTNTGNTTLNTVVLTDTFPAADLTFVSASTAPNTVAAGSLTWNNVGPLTQGQSASITLNFTGLSSAAPAINSVLADAGGGVTDTDSANVIITNPAHTVTKSLLGLGPNPASIGDNVYFRIVVQNTGDTAIATIPLEDTYSGADFDFISATLAPTSTGSGSLFWSDITGGGSLAIGGSITIDVTLQAKGAANPANNTATAAYSEDENDDPLPPSSSTSSIVLLAAKITGTVYNDADESGGFTAGDTGLTPVTVQLFTDPNGDGNPADGALAGLTTTDTNGYYEFLNLGLGDYVVVENDPSGYTSSGDTVNPNDNRIPVDVNALATFANRNFFDYLPDPNDYATITGKVWNDANASGTVTGGETGIENVTIELVQDINNNGLADPGEPVTASTVTIADGSYSFSMIPPGEYVIRETDRFGWTSTADTDMPDDNQIEITATAGATSANNDFLDVLTGTVSGLVYYDANYNGSYNIGIDAPLANVGVIVTDSLGNSQTVFTDVNGTWTATVPPGSTTANIDNADPDFTSVFVNTPVQTEGTDPTNVVAASSSNVSAGNDGFMDPGIITGRVWADTDNDDIGDIGIQNVTLRLTDGSGNDIDSDSGTLGVQPTTTITDLNGDYTFSGLVPGNYRVYETQPAGYQSIGDLDGGDLDIIGDVTVIIVDPGDTESGKNFIEEQFGSISGSVLADTDNNGTGDIGIQNVVLTLLDISGAVIDGDPNTGGVQPITATTDVNGAYTFTNVPPGGYRAGEAQPLGYQSISDEDGGNLDQIGDISPILVSAGLSSADHDFVEEQLGTITGYVFADADNNGSGDDPMQGVSVSLFTDPNGDGDPSDGSQLGAAVTTDINGLYTFSGVEPGSYVVIQSQPAGYLTVSDEDTTDPGDDAANASALDNSIPVGISAGETDDGNNFVEEQPGIISGTVFAGASPLQNVSLALFTDPNGDGDPADGSQLGSSQLTNPGGAYTFTNVPPGDYVVAQTQPAGWVTVSDADTTVPGDDTADAGADNRIPVSIEANETDDGNSFIEGCPTITVNPATLPNGTVGSAYNQTLSATGGTAPYSFAVTAGSLPAGLTLSGATISGIPTSAASETFTITATDNLGCTGSRQYTVEPVCPTITVNPSSLPGATVGSAYSQTVSATGGTAPYTFAVTAGSLPVGLSLAGDTITGTPTAAGTANFTITATDNHGCTGSRALSITSTCPTITISPASLPNGVVGSAYSQALSASGGTAPYTFAVTAGTLPAGLNLVGNSITGTPTSTASHNFTITATDANNCTGSRAFTVAPVCPTISLTSAPAPLPGGTTGTAYSGTINASGGAPAYTFALKAGSSLPAGLVLSSGGAISGTPTTSGSTNFIIVATDENGCEGEAAFTISVGCPTITVTPATLSNGVVGTAYGPVTFNQTGGTGAITWSQSGALPAGMSFNTGTAQLGGIPTEAGSYNITVIATDVNGCAGSVNLSFSTSCPAITVNPAALPNGVVGSFYSETLSATGGTGLYTFAVTAGTLPAGLNLAGSTISGTPTSTASHIFTITATDDNGCTGSRACTVAPVCPTITVNPATLPDAVVGTVYNQSLSAGGGAIPYSFAVTAGSLPAGLSLSGGIISGTPTTAGTSNFTVTATDNHGCTGSRSLSITANCPTITVNSAALPDAVVGTAYNQSLSATDGTAPYTFAVTAGSLPAGLNLSSGGVLSGMPTAAGTSNFTVTATDNYGCTGARSLSIIANCPTITVSPASLPNGVVGSASNEMLSASGGTAPYTFAVTAGTLPAGLLLAGDTISGTPTSTASHNFTITATDANNCTGSRAFTVAPACPTISLTSTPAPLPGGTIGVAYSGTINASGGTPAYTFALKAGSSLPPGLNLSSGGVITGAPTASGGTTFTIVATDLNGCEGEAAFTISVGCPTITVTPGSLSDGVVGTAYGPVTFNASGGTGAITWSQSGALPAGMSFNTGTAQLGGTPTEAGGYNITVIATDANGCTGSVNLSFSTSCPTITVSPATLPNGNVGSAYSETLSASGGTAPYTFAVTSGTLPAGLLLAGDTITGSPTTAGTANFTITATDANGCAGSRALSINVLSATISGTVFADIDNDGSGDVAIVGASVSLFTDPNNDGDPIDGTIVGLPAATNGGGVYTFAGVPPGNYVAVLSPAPGRLPVTDGDTTISGDDLANPSTTDRRIPVSLTAGESDDGNNFVEEQSATIGNLVWADENNDGIKDAGESGIDNVTVELLDGSGDAIDSDPLTGGVQPMTALTAGGGLFSFAGLAPGDYQLRIATPPTSHPISSSVTDILDNGQDDDDNGSQSVAGGTISSPVFALAAGESDSTMDFGLVAAGSLGNLVWHDANNNGAKEGGESGIGSVVIVLLDSLGSAVDDPNQAGVQPYIATTNGSGAFAFANLVPGSYRLWIASPPAAQPQSSSITDTLDNSEDDDDNGIQTMPTAPVSSPLIAIAHGETENTVDFGFVAVAGTKSISGQVRDDYDQDGSFSDNDQPVASVTVKLYADTNGNGSFDPGADLEIASTTTDGLGNYQFNGLPDGTYFVQEVDPRPSSSTADVDGANDNIIKVVLSGGGSGASSTGNDFLDGVDPAGYIYHSVTGQIIAGGSVSVSGPGTITILMDGSTGQYSFVADTAGTFTITCSPPLGYMIDPLRPVAGASFDPTGGPDPTILGSSEDGTNPGYLANFTAGANPYYLVFDLAPGDPFVINNNIPLVEIKPATFAAWQYSNPLGGDNDSDGNPDGDRYDNLAEYAFCYYPDGGVCTGCPLEIVLNGDGAIDAKVRRVPSLTDVTYTLEYIADLASSGPGGTNWTDVTTILPTTVNNGDGTETATYANLASIPALAGGRGFVRIRVDLDVDFDTIPDATSRTLAAGWSTRSLTVQCQTCSTPFVECDLFGGGVDSVVGNTLNAATSVGGGSIAGIFAPGAQYYIEVIGGDNAGHRFDIDEAASTATTIAISMAAGNHNTLAAAPASLAGDRIVLRRHLTLDDVFRKSEFTATNNQGTADRLLFFNSTTGAFGEIYWLFANGGSPKWVLAGDAGLSDAGGRTIDPREAVYAHCRTTPVSLVLNGTVRENVFACPLDAGNNLIGSGFPLDASPAARGMTVANGFTGGRDPRLVDQIKLWDGDATSAVEAYNTHFLVEAPPLSQWSPQGNASLLNENNLPLFKALHGAFIKSIAGHSTWVIAVPWIP